MANETIKALLMIAMFGALETGLHFPRIRMSQWRNRLHLILRPLWPEAAPRHHVLQPVKVRHGLRKR
jgi:hypothetical protein